jgi:hypothetical protein
MSALAAVIKRDLRIAWRVGGGALIGVLFFLIVVVLMPFAVGPDLALLTRLGPAILWLGALLASLLTLDRLFLADHEDGSLDLIAMGRTPLELTCAAKALAHWLAAGLGGGADAAGRHAGADFYGNDRRGAGGDAASRRIVAGGAGAAAVDPGADFRRRGVASGDYRTVVVRGAVFDPVRAVAHQFCHWTIRRSCELAAWAGLTVRRCRSTLPEPQ